MTRRRIALPLLLSLCSLVCMGTLSCSTDQATSIGSDLVNGIDPRIADFDANYRQRAIDVPVDSTGSRQEIGANVHKLDDAKMIDAGIWQGDTSIVYFSFPSIAEFKDSTKTKSITSAFLYFRPDTLARNPNLARKFRLRRLSTAKMDNVAVTRSPGDSNYAEVTLTADTGSIDSIALVGSVLDAEVLRHEVKRDTILKIKSITTRLVQRIENGTTVTYTIADTVLVIDTILALVTVDTSNGIISADTIADTIFLIDTIVTQITSDTMGGIVSADTTADTIYQVDTITFRLVSRTEGGTITTDTIPDTLWEVSRIDVDSTSGAKLLSPYFYLEPADSAATGTFHMMAPYIKIFVKTTKVLSTGLDTLVDRIDSLPCSAIDATVFESNTSRGTQPFSSSGSGRYSIAKLDLAPIWNTMIDTATGMLFASIQSAILPLVNTEYVADTSIRDAKDTINDRIVIAHRLLAADPGTMTDAMYRDIEKLLPMASTGDTVNLDIRNDLLTLLKAGKPATAYFFVKTSVVSKDKRSHHVQATWNLPAGGTVRILSAYSFPR